MEINMPAARKLTLSLALVSILAVLSDVAQATNVQVSQAWIRPAVKGQSGTGGYMRLLSPQGGTLLGFAAPVATAELHEMSMEGDVMRMRPLKALTLPAGQPVDLKPGSYHLMLMNLKRPLRVGDMVSLTLKLQGADGKVSTQFLKVPVLNAAPEASGAAASVASMPEMGHMGQHPEPVKEGMGMLDRMPKERKPQ
jgi:copper(I)-binding protein